MTSTEAPHAGVAAEQAQTIIGTVVNDPNLSQSSENSYLANLNKVGTFIQQGKTQSAVNQLNAFIQKVEQDYSHSIITQAERDQFVALAQALIDDLQAN